MSPHSSPCQREAQPRTFFAAPSRTHKRTLPDTSTKQMKKQVQLLASAPRPTTRKGTALQLSFATTVLKNKKITAKKQKNNNSNRWKRMQLQMSFATTHIP